MKTSLFSRLVVFMISVIAILIFSQGLWLWQQLKEQKQDFELELKNTLQSMISFHALQGYKSQNQNQPNTATLSMHEISDDERDRDTSHELGRYNINTQEYIHNFSLFKAIESTFTDKSLIQGKINLTAVDSLFHNNFNEVGIIRFSKMELLKEERVIDSLCTKEFKNTSNKTQISFPLGTTNIYTFRFTFKLRTFPFLKQMLYTISISGIAVILVAIFMLWLLGALHQRIAQLQWREQAVRGIVHDLKSPLSYVYTFLDYIASKEQQPSVKKQLQNASTKISKLTNKMELFLTLFGNKNQKIVLTPSNFNLKQACNEILSELRVVYQNKQIECNLDIEDDLIMNVDNFYFEAVIRNLMDNAIKYSDSSPKLLITSKKNQTELHLSFTDFGNGISPKDQKKIFREFYRSNSSIKGHGIGLSFSMKIVKSHQGRINLSSEIEKGSTFCIILPANLIVK